MSFGGPSKLNVKLYTGDFIFSLEKLLMLVWSRLALCVRNYESSTIRAPPDLPRKNWGVGPILIVYRLFHIAKSYTTMSHRLDPGPVFKRGLLR